MSSKPPRDPRCPPKRSKHDCPAPINPCTIGQPKQKKQKIQKQEERTEDDEDCEPEEELDCGDDEPTCLDVMREEEEKAAKRAAKAAKAAVKKAKSGSAGGRRIIVDDDDDDDDEDAGVCAPSKQPTCRDTATQKQKPC